MKDGQGNFLADVCTASRKDFRNAVVAARNAQGLWQDRSAFNRSQIIYRIAEMLQQKESLFVNEMLAMGYSQGRAQSEFQQCIDLLVYYSGWCDKYVQVYSAVNPVASSHFNFSLPEPTGVVAAMASNGSALLGMVQAIIPGICGGNTVIALASEAYPLPAISFAEVLATSDLPAGVVNILTGTRTELRHHFASHKDVNAITAWNVETVEGMEIGKHAADTVKHVKYYSDEGIEVGSPDYIMDLQEIKTTWHPVENIVGAGSGY